MLPAERACPTYAFDAYCAWCYGFGPVVRAFAEDNAHRIRLSVVSAGLCTGARALPVAAYPHLPAERGTVTRLTGVAFGTGYGRAVSRGTAVPYRGGRPCRIAGDDRAVSRGTAVLDSTDAAAGLAALREQPGISELDATEAVQRAWFVDGPSPSDVEVYRGIAGEFGLDADAVTAAYTSPAGRVQARADFRTLRRLRVLCYPTLLLDSAHGADRMGGAASTAAFLTSALDQRLTTSIPQVPIHDLPLRGEPS